MNYQTRRDNEHKRNVQQWTEALVIWEVRENAFNAQWSHLDDNSPESEVDAYCDAHYEAITRHYAPVLMQCAAEIGKDSATRAQRDAIKLAKLQA